MISFYVNTDFMAKVLTGRGSQYMQECSLMGIKASQALSNTIVFNMRHLILAISYRLLWMELFSLAGTILS